MPVQQISVGPGRETASNGKGAPRSKDKNEGGKSSGRSGSRSSSVSKVSSSGAGAAPRTSGSPPSQDICSSGQLTRVEEGASDTNKKTSKHTRAGTMTVNVAAQTQKKQVKRRHRRKRDSCTALDCADTVTKLDPADRSPSSDRSDRGEKQERAPKARRELPARLRSSAPLESDSSSDEEGWREARSWSKEKARRGRRRSRSSRERDGERVSGVNGGGGDKGETMELQSVDSNEGKESRAMLEDGGGLKKRRGGGGSSERERGSQKGDSQGRERRKQHGSLKSRSPAGSSSLPEEGEELITKRYQEKGMGGGDMSVPSPEKCSAVNGGMAQPCSEDSELEVCRICHCEGEEECPLITPCRCTGSLRFVHQACLNQWIKSSDTRCCELCKYDFIMETQLKPLRMWEKLQMTKSERRKIFCSVLFHLIAVACVLWSVYVLVRRTAEEIRFGRNGILEWPFWTKLTVVAIGFTGGVIFMYIQCKVYLQLWCRLKAFNRIITVQNCPEKGQPSSQAPSATLANGKHQRAAVPINSVPVPVTVPVWEVQTDSDMSVEAAVAPAQSPV